jgi:hypothetical protein
MACAEVKEALDRGGIAVLYRQGESSVSLYDRFVGERAFCQAGYTTARERIAVADTDECPVRKCIKVRRFGGLAFLRKGTGRERFAHARYLRSAPANLVNPMM